MRHFKLHPEDMTALHLTINQRAVETNADLAGYACGYQGRSGPYEIDQVTLGPAEATAPP